MTESQKYLKGRIDPGIAKGSQNEYFILDRTVENVATMYAHELLNKAIANIRKKSAINGIKGLCAKADVIKSLKSLKENKFEIPHECYK